MISRITEIIGNTELRSWLKYKILHPNDIGPGQVSFSLPPYLKSGQFSSFKSLRSRTNIPEMCPVKFDENINDITAMMATKSCFFKYENISSLFKMGSSFHDRFHDQEDISAIYRLKMILSNIEKYGAYGPIEELILFEWIGNPVDSDIAWEAYTIAERISNIGMFLCRTQCHLRWSEEKLTLFQTRINREAKRIFENLEYGGEHYTGNHLANNGRGLIWAGALVGSKKIAKIGIKIMLEESNRILQKDGILREGSPHYHMLVTRNFIEGYWLAEYLSIEEHLEDFDLIVKRMIKGCKFLTLQGVVPRIGDISPDAPPEWFISVKEWLDTRDGQQERGIGEGWISHFFEKVSRDHSIPSHNIMDDFARVDAEDYSILVHLNNEGCPILVGHAHADSGAPYIVYKKEPLLIDLGRADYKPDSRYFASAWAHNSAIVDNQPLEYVNRGIYGRGFLSYLSDESPLFEVTENEIHVTHSGFRRLGVEFKRSIKIANGILLTYCFRGRGKHKIQIPLHFNPNLSISVDWPKMGTFRPLITFPDGNIVHQSPYYGEVKECSSYLWEARVDLPVELRFYIKPK